MQKQTQQATQTTKPITQTTKQVTTPTQTSSQKMNIAPDMKLLLVLAIFGGLIVGMIYINLVKHKTSGSKRTVKKKRKR